MKTSIQGLNFGMGMSNRSGSGNSNSNIMGRISAARPSMSINPYTPNQGVS
jgi:hypothetical protein